MTTDVTRELAPQRTIALYTDQETKLDEISKLLGKKISLSQVVREGLDSMISDLQKKVKKGDITNVKKSG
jgi:hypothetical protein